MKNFILAVFALGLFALVGKIYYDRQHIDSAPGDNEKYPHKLARYRTGADAALAAECTNVVVGLRLILNQRTETFDDNFTKWVGTATVEFINALGGMERTNLEFRFDPGYSGEPRWFKKLKP